MDERIFSSGVSKKIGSHKNSSPLLKCQTKQDGEPFHLSNNNKQVVRSHSNSKIKRIHVHVCTCVFEVLVMSPNKLTCMP